MSRDWKIDYDRLERAARGLGLKRRVRARTANLKKAGGSYLGIHHPSGQHHIRVASDLDAEAASFVLWHELGHALQAERLARERGKPIEWGAYEHWRQWLRQMHAAGINDGMLADETFDHDVYDGTPFEVDANALALKMSYLKLTKPRPVAAPRAATLVA